MKSFIVNVFHNTFNIWPYFSIVIKPYLCSQQNPMTESPGNYPSFILDYYNNKVLNVQLFKFSILIVFRKKSLRSWIGIFWQLFLKLLSRKSGTLWIMKTYSKSSPGVSSLIRDFIQVRWSQLFIFFQVRFFPS